MQNDQTAEIQNAEISFAKDSEIQKFCKPFNSFCGQKFREDGK